MPNKNNNSKCFIDPVYDQQDWKQMLNAENMPEECHLFREWPLMPVQIYRLFWLPSGYPLFWGNN